MTLPRALLPFLLLGASACDADGGRASREADHSTRWTVAEDALFSLGSVDGPGETTFSRVSDVVLLSDGGVAVSDATSGEIRVFEGDGSVRFVVGRLGEGPGEFGWIGGLQHHAPDSLVVHDAEYGRLTTLRTDGSLLGSTITFRVEEGRPEVHLGRFADGSHAFAWIDLVHASGAERPALVADRMPIGRFRRDGAGPTVLSESVGMRRLELREDGVGGGPIFRGPVPYSPHFLGIVVGDTAFHTDGIGGTVRRTTSGGDALEPLRVGGVAIDPADAAQRLRPRLDSAMVALFDDALDHPGVDTVPTFAEMLADDARRLWLKAYDPATDSHWVSRKRTGGTWRVFETDGETVATVSVPEGFRPMDVRGDRVAGVRYDELGVEYVEVRALVRGTEGTRP